jgi:hypothetical protein
MREPPDAVTTVLSPGPALARVGVGLITGVVLLGACVAGVLGGVRECATSSTPATAPASATAHETIPAAYLTLYRRAGTAYRVPWPVLAAIGAIESDHGRSHAPGVQSGVNAYAKRSATAPERQDYSRPAVHVRHDLPSARTAPRRDNRAPLRRAR